MLTFLWRVPYFNSSVGASKPILSDISDIDDMMRVVLLQILHNQLFMKRPPVHLNLGQIYQLKSNKQKQYSSVV